MNEKDFSWSFWFTVPIYPYGRRRTIRKEVIRDTIWTFDQLQGIFYVVVPIRMTVVKLKAGGLLVYAPVAPTRECLNLMEELVAEHGDVKYIILPTISGLEHKAFVGPFARCFPHAQVYVAPRQWSFPVNLPLSWLGLPGRRTQILPEDSSKTPFAEEFDYKILQAINLRLGWFSEVAFFHKRSRTLLVTDLIVSIPEVPPAILQLDPYPLLFHAKDRAADVIEDTPDNRRQGWQRICLFALYFRPSVLEVAPWGKVFREAFQAPERSRKAFYGLFPFRWKPDWQRCFHSLRGNGNLLVAPILQTLILNRNPQETLAWVNQVASWDFGRIIPCHFDSPLTADGKEFRQAFSFLEKSFGINPRSLPEDDLQLLRGIDQGLYKSGLVPPPKER